MPQVGRITKVTRKKSRQQLQMLSIYSREDLAEILDLSVQTIIRAYNSKNLEGYKVGRAVRHSGQQAINWLEAGGKTGRHTRPREESKPVEALAA